MTDTKLLEIAEDFRGGILQGRSSSLMCFAVSAALQGFLSALCNIETELVELDFEHCNHVVLRLSDGRILDATADQFDGMPAVYLGEMPALYREWMCLPSGGV